MISNVPWSGSRQGTGSPASELSWHRHLTLDLAAIVLTTVQRYRYPSPLGSAKAAPESADKEIKRRNARARLRAQASLAKDRQVGMEPVTGSYSAVIVHAPG